MRTITDTHTRQRLARLDAHVRTLDAALVALAEQRASAGTRIAALDDRLAAEHAHPAAEDPATHDLAAALAADPSAPIDAKVAERLQKSRSATEQRNEAATAMRAIVSDAIGKVRYQVDEIETEIARIGTERRVAWASFAAASYDALLAEFRARCASLVEATINPMLALLDMRDDEGGPVVSGSAPRLSDDTAIKLRWPQTVGWGSETFVESRERRHPRDYPAALEAFRASLIGG